VRHRRGGKMRTIHRGSSFAQGDPLKRPLVEPTKSSGATQQDQLDRLDGDGQNAPRVVAVANSAIRVWSLDWGAGRWCGRYAAAPLYDSTDGEGAMTGLSALIRQFLVTKRAPT